MKEANRAYRKFIIEPAQLNGSFEPESRIDIFEQMYKEHTLHTPVRIARNQNARSFIQLNRFSARSSDPISLLF